MTEPRESVRARIADLSAIDFWNRADLLAQGWKTHDLTDAVRAGRLVRVRRGIYARPTTAPELIDAVRVGGRIACLSLLQMIGVFVRSCTHLHVQVPPTLSRSRHRRTTLARLHWCDPSTEALRHAVSVEDAVRQSVRCQDSRDAIATLDSVLHHGLLTRENLDRIFGGLPARYRRLLALVDGSAESGPETYLRLILRSLGLRFETQVFIEGVGRVDFLVEGWLVIECDSKTFHEGWRKQVEDRRRDMAAARLGFVTIRPLAADLFSNRQQVRADVMAVVAAFAPMVSAVVAPQLRRKRRARSVATRSRTI